MDEFRFYAMLSRMKYINRWGLMRNTRNENISEHSLDTAIIAHGLAVIGNRIFGRSYDASRAALLAVFHDATEIITGDLPTPVKYHSEKIRSAYREVENVAQDSLLSLLPQEFAEDYRDILGLSDPEDAKLKPLIKAADKLSAIIKCIEEKKSGNQEFEKAEEALKQAVKDLQLPEADFFMENCLPSYSLTLDEL